MSFLDNTRVLVWGLVAACIPFAVVAEDIEPIFLDKNWKVTREPEIAGCWFEHRTHDFSVFLGMDGPTDTAYQPNFWVFASAPKEFGTSIVTMNGKQLPTPSSKSELYSENDLVFFELEYLSDISDDLNSRLVAQSLLSRFRNGEAVGLGDYLLELGDGAAAFSNDNLRECFNRRVRKSDAQRLGVPLDAAKIPIDKVEICQLVPLNSSSFDEAEVRYYQDDSRPGNSNYLHAVFAAKESYPGGQAHFVEVLDCENENQMRCVRDEVIFFDGGQYTHYQTQLIRENSKVDFSIEYFEDPSFDAVLEGNGDVETHTFKLENCRIE